MSTSAIIIIKDDHSKQHFYRHSDGYPEGTMPTLEKFLSYVKEGKIRNNVSQSCGWLVVIGAEEYKNKQIEREENLKSWDDFTPEEEENWKDKIPTTPKNWKVGSYEPISGINCGEEYIYTVDLKKLTIEYK